MTLNELPSIDPDSGRLNVVIDTPKGFRRKYKFDEKLGVFRLSRLLPQGMSFPYDFGFIPSTHGEDDDPLDVLLLMDASCVVGNVIPARLIGIVEAEQTVDGTTTRNDRFIAVVETDQTRAECRSLEEIDGQRLEEIDHFFVSDNQMEGRRFQPLRRQGARYAEDLLKKRSNPREKSVRR